MGMCWCPCGCDKVSSVPQKHSMLGTGRCSPRVLTAAGRSGCVQLYVHDAGSTLNLAEGWGCRALLKARAVGQGAGARLGSQQLLANKVALETPRQDSSTTFRGTGCVPGAWTGCSARTSLRPSQAGEDRQGEALLVLGVRRGFSVEQQSGPRDSHKPREAAGGRKPRAKPRQ